MKIKVLSDIVINQIAAGEVVERPASVVRELVDNAVDAGATDIFIALESGGHTKIRVRDNGCGMTRDEAVLAFERHATSKVTSLEDLNALATLGFRGEALASIAAVSKIRLTTRSREDGVGCSVTFRGGKLVDVQACAWNEGTEIEVEHLFFNTPARRKFLKSPRAEVARVRSWVGQSALGRPDIRYRLVSDGDEVLNLPRVDSIAARSTSLFSGELTAVSLSEGGLKVEGMIGHPGQALSDASGFVTLINGRLVSDKLILRAVREGYDSMLKDREFPVGYIALTIKPDYVDVNVHPQKSEVRFRLPDQVFAVVRGAVLTAVRSIRRPTVAGIVENESSRATIAPPTPPQPVSRFEWPIPAPAPSFQGTLVSQGTLGSAGKAAPDVLPLSARGAPVSPPSFQPSFFVSNAAPAYSELEDRKSCPDFSYSQLRYIGQLLGCYLVCEFEERLVVVDMHAAHERVNYNKIRSARAQHALTVQKLLIPERLVLSLDQVATLADHGEVLKELAFEVSPINATTVEVTGVPGVLAHLDCRAIVKEIAAEPVVSGWRGRLEERIDHMTARLACHASVRSGDALSKSEAYALFAQLDEAELAGACPHGRPVVAEFPRDAVERWFGRDR